MFTMNQLRTAYGLQFGNDDEMKLFKEYTEFEEELSKALAEVTPQLERERTENLKAIGDFIDHGMLDLVLAFQEADDAEYDARYLLKSA